MNHRNIFSLRRTVFATMVLILTALTLGPVPDASAQGEPFLELLRKDVQAEKVKLMTVALDLNTEQGEVFWPLYRDYEIELSKLGDERIKLIKDFAANYDAMTEEMAKELAKTSFKLREKRLDLLKKTHKKVSKEIGPIMATRFSQIESQLLLLVDLQIAAELPLIK
jgi:hypothetical protein